MRIRIVVLWLATLALFIGATSQDAVTEAKVSLSRGIEALRGSDPQSAVQHFTRAVQLDPKLTVAELYLATSYATLYVPGAQSAANEEFARKALEIYEKLVRLEPDNVDAVAGLAGIYQNSGNLPKARENYLKLTRMTPQSATAYYSVGAIDWALAYDKSNPLSAAEKTRAIDEGLALLDIAIALDPQYEDAMIYKNLLLREKASATSDAAERSRLIAEADAWFSRTLEVRKRRVESGPQGGERPQVSGPLPSPPPPPPPPPPPSRGQASISRPVDVIFLIAVPFAPQ